MAWDTTSDGNERDEEVLRELERRRMRGESFVALEAPKGSRKLVRNFWAQAWCRHLESYQVYESRLPRGRSYLRQGRLYNLTIEPGVVSATVTGGSIYEVTVTVGCLDRERWGEILKGCSEKVGSLLDLLEGKLGAGILKELADPERGIFPTPNEIRFSCTCPDWADLCKHSAAVLYGVAVKFDVEPELFFKLRDVDPTQLIAEGKAQALSEPQGINGGLEGEDLSALFGIDLTQE